MYHVNKTVAFFLSPAGIAFVAFFTAALLAGFSRVRAAGATLVAAVAWLWLWMTPVMTRFVGVPLENAAGEACPLRFDAVPEAEAAVLLGGGVGLHRKCGSGEMHFGADRVRVAAALLKKGRAKKLFLTGPDARAAVLPILEDFGVDPAACEFFENARNTEEEVSAIAKRMDGRILLVTSAWHMPRAKLLFERRGFEVVTCPADFEMHYVAERDLSLSDFLPSADAFLRNSYAFKEWVALVGYKLFR